MLKMACGVIARINQSQYLYCHGMSPENARRACKTTENLLHLAPELRASSSKVYTTTVGRRLLYIFKEQISKYVDNLIATCVVIEITLVE